MAAFRVHRNTSATSQHYPFIVDVQSELLSNLETTLAIPLSASAEIVGRPIRNLNPTIVIGQKVYVVLTQQMAAIPKAFLGEEMEDVVIDRSQVLSSIDFLVTGI